MTPRRAAPDRKTEDPPPAQSFGPLLARLRRGRGVSQFQLGLAADVSTRHVCFLEGGRAAPSRTMVLRLAQSLEVDAADRAALLRAAGFTALPDHGGSDPALAFPMALSFDQTSSVADLLQRAASCLDQLGVDRPFAERLLRFAQEPAPVQTLVRELERRPAAAAPTDPAQRLAHRILCDSLARRLVDALGVEFSGAAIAELARLRTAQQTVPLHK
jgi:transcriptional regulator with XRE-family HTH domain